MALTDVIAKESKEIAGSRTKNRLTVQISYAMQLIMDFYQMDFLVLMDYIEDIAIINNPDNPSVIHLYQVKTKSSGKQYLLNTVIKDEWFQKLYKNVLKYKGYVKDASIVCNTDIVSNQESIFPNEKNKLSDDLINKNIQKIRKVIAKDQNMNEEDVDLSRFFFIRTHLSIKGHKDEVEHQFEDFLLRKDSELQVATARTIYRCIYDELDKKFNEEIDENCSDVEEIFQKKGVDSKKIKDVISGGLAIQFPASEKLFDVFNITSVKAIRGYQHCFSQIKMDMFSDKRLFVETRRKILNIIEEVNDSGIDDMPGILQNVYDKCKGSESIPSAYAEECYLKMLIMVLTYKYCYGGEEI